MNKIRVIEQSVGCQSFGVGSLTPLIGIGFAVVALSRYHRARAEAGHEWNPARTQLIRGAVLAWVGLLINLVAFTIVLLHIWLDAST
ncbi:MAG: hypothetical protein ABSH14_05335 [Verrucomicrobiia bacterium]|jgi:tellurite resistance protein TehA-like permease